MLNSENVPAALVAISEELDEIRQRFRSKLVKSPPLIGIGRGLRDAEQDRTDIPIARPGERRRALLPEDGSPVLGQRARDEEDIVVGDAPRDERLREQLRFARKNAVRKRLAIAERIGPGLRLRERIRIGPLAERSVQA